MLQLEERWKQALRQVSHECHQEKQDQLSEYMMAKIKVLQHAATAMATAAEYLDSLEMESNSKLIEQNRNYDNNVKLLLRFMILKEIVFKGM